MLDLPMIPVDPHPEVPIRRQIAARIEAAVREGELLPGVRLPDVRALALRVGVHRNTAWAVYRELTSAGLVRAVPGAGVYVREPGTPPRDPFRAYLARERAAGRTARSLAAHFREWAGTLEGHRVGVVEPLDGLLRLLIEELRLVLGSSWEVTGVSLSTALRRPAILTSRIVVGRPLVCAQLRTRLPTRLLPWTELVPLPLRGGCQELRRVARLRPPAVVGILTVSRSIRRYARELLAGWARRGISLMTPVPGRAREVERARRIAALLFADLLCVADPGLAGCRRVLPFRCVREEALKEISRYLGRGRDDDRAGREDRRRSSERAVRTVTKAAAPAARQERSRALRRVPAAPVRNL